MHWFFIALIAPALYAVTNHIDKYLITKYYTEEDDDDVGSLILFSSLFAVFVLPVIALIEPNIFKVSLDNALWLIMVGVTAVVAITLYLYAMERDEASIVVPFFQTIPIFGYILGLVFLGEVMTSQQILFSLLIIIAAMILSIEFEPKKIKLKTDVILLMLGSSFLYALGSLIFKMHVTIDDFWASTFWSCLGIFLSGLLIFVSVKKYRQGFLRVLKRSKGKVLGLNCLNETLSTVGEIIFDYAIILAPLALVLMANVFQPFFVFVYGVILTIFFPKISQEKLTMKHLAQKIGAIVIMFIGSYLLYF